MLFSRVVLSLLVPTTAVLSAPVAAPLDVVKNAAALVTSIANVADNIVTSVTTPLLNIVNDIFADNFIVVLKTQSDAGFLDFLAQRDAALVEATDSTFNFGDFQGFTALLSKERLASIKNWPQVKYIEPVTEVTASALTSQKASP